MKGHKYLLPHDSVNWHLGGFPKTQEATQDALNERLDRVEKRLDDIEERLQILEKLVGNEALDICREYLVL